MINISMTLENKFICHLKFQIDDFLLIYLLWMIQAPNK